MTQDAKPKVIYIAGYGRSGSTILSIILGTHPQMVSVGELGFLIEEYHDRTCSCGELYTACAFWKDLPFSLAHPEEVDRKRIHKVEQRSQAMRLLTGRIPLQEKQIYQVYQQNLFAFIRSRSQKSIVIDSSKSARYMLGRFYALQHLAGQEVYVIHLVRNGWAALESLMLTGSNWQLEGHTVETDVSALRATLGWLITNLSVSILGLLPGVHILRLRYEDFIRDPHPALQKIGSFCAVDTEMLQEAIEHDEAFTVGHMTGGNRVRFEQTIHVRFQSKPVDLHKLSTSQKLTFRLLAGWLNLLYGYSGS